MVLTVELVLLIIAFICFLLATFGVALGRLNLIALGLALWVLAVILPGVRG